MAWKGKWVFAVGVIHTLFGLAFMRATLAVLWSERLFNTVNGQPTREAVFWFLCTGLLLMIIGVLIDQAEQNRLAVPWVVIWALVLLTIVGLIVMPISGIWFLLPPVVGLVISGWKTKHNAAGVQ